MVMVTVVPTGGPRLARDPMKIGKIHYGTVWSRNCAVVSGGERTKNQAGICLMLKTTGDESLMCTKICFINIHVCGSGRPRQSTVPHQCASTAMACFYQFSNWVQWQTGKCISFWMDFVRQKWKLKWFVNCNYASATVFQDSGGVFYMVLSSLLIPRLSLRPHIYLAESDDSNGICISTCHLLQHLLQSPGQRRRRRREGIHRDEKEDSVTVTWK